MEEIRTWVVGLSKGAERRSYGDQKLVVALVVKKKRKKKIRRVRGIFMSFVF